MMKWKVCLNLVSNYLNTNFLFLKNFEERKGFKFGMLSKSIVKDGVYIRVTKHSYVGRHFYEIKKGLKYGILSKSIVRDGVYI